MSELYNEQLEKEAMDKLYNPSMPDAIEPSNRDLEEVNDDIQTRIAIYIKNRESLDVDIEYIAKEASFAPGIIEVYKEDNWKWEGVFNANILGEFKNGNVLDFPEITLSNELSNIEKIDILDKLIYEKQIEMLSIKDNITEQLILSLIKSFLLDNSLESWKRLGFNKIINLDKVLLDDKREINVYNYFKNLFNLFIYNKNIDEIIGYIDIDNIPKVIIPIEASFDLMFSLFECLIGGERSYFLLYDNGEFKEWT